MSESGLDEPGDAEDPLAFARRVQAEVEAEAALRRRRDPDLEIRERALARAWADVAPPGATGDQRELLIDRFERLALVDVDAPTGARPGIRQVKGALRKLNYWYLRYLADQINAVNGVLARLLRRLDQRIEVIEDALEMSPPGPVLLDPVPEPSAAVTDLITELFDEGPVAVASCGPGAVVEALGGRVLAYGVDADAGALGDGARRGLDLRPGDPREHLAGLGEGALSGLVLRGFVEDLTAASAHRLIEEAIRVVRPGQPVVVAVSDPADRGVVERDIRGGRGLAPPTWAHLAGRLGADNEIVETADERIRQIVVVTAPPDR